MHQTWIRIRCRFHSSAVTPFSKIISRSTMTQFSLMIFGSPVAECMWQFHAVAMNQFLLSIWCVGRALDSIRHLSLRFQLWFQGLQGLCFRWRFLVSTDVVFTDDSMHQRWLRFLYWCHASNRNYFSLSIPSVSRDSNFKYDFSFCSDSVFADDLWINIGRVCLTIPCISHKSIFGIDLMHKSCCRFHTSAVTQILVVISRSVATMFLLTISGY